MSESRARYDEPSPLGQAALEYARRGWWVFPLEPRGKKPLGRLVPHGLTQATNDLAQIEEWWRKAPNANIGISCGPSRIVVIDVDERHGGDESIKDLTVQYPELADTIQAATGGGGWHLVYEAPAIPVPNSTGSLAPGLDVRGVGGYIVAPPSIHPNGTAYEWYADYGPDERKPGKLPLPIIEALTTPQEGADTPVDVASILQGVSEGERDWKLFQLAAKCRYADFPIDWAYRAVGEAAAACVPPFPQDQARRKVESAYRYQAGKTAIVAPPAVDPETGETLPIMTRVMLDKHIAGDPEPTRWLIPDVLVRGRIHLLYGEPESGKTIISLSWMLHTISLGLPVVYIDEETGTTEAAQLLAAMGAEKVDELLHYFPFPSVEMGEGTEALIAYCEELQPALIVFDSLTDMLSSAGLDENSGIEVTSWFRIVAQRLARAPYEPAVSMVDHIPKDSPTQKYSVASRAKKSKSDVLWYVEKETDFDRTKTSLVTLHRHKNRPGVLPKTVVYVVGGENQGLICRRYDAVSEGDVITTLRPTQRQILEVLRANTDSDGLDISALKQQTMRSRRGIEEALKGLMALDLVDREEAGKSYVYFASTQVRNTYANAELRTQAPHPPSLEGGGVAQVPLRREPGDESCVGEDDEEEIEL